MGEMSPEQVTEAARFLVNARASFRQLRGLPAHCLPETVDDGYQVQSAFSAEWGLDLSGWKIACTSKDQQKLVGVKEPFVGRIFKPFLIKSPAKLSAGSYHMLGIESEFAFELKRDLKPKKAGYTREQVERAVGKLYPAIELVDTRLTEWTTRGAPSLIADNAANGALIVGEGVSRWRKLDLAKHKVTLEVGGEIVGKGTGRKVLGHPLKALTWMINDRSARGHTLAAGQIITTGTVTSLNFAQAGDEVVADFGVLGDVRITFTD